MTSLERLLGRGTRRPDEQPAEPPVGGAAPTTTPPEPVDPPECSPPQRHPRTARSRRARIGRRAATAVLVIGVASAAVFLVLAILEEGRLVELPGSLANIAHALVVGGVILLLAGSLLFGEGYVAGIWLTSTLMPWVAAVATIVAYLAWVGPSDPIGERIVAVYFGLAVTIVAVGAGGFLGRPLCRRERAQARTHDRLRDRYAQLRERYLQLRAASATSDASPADRRAQFDTAMAEARSRLRAVHRELCDPDRGGPALRWALATGYTNILRTLHRVEEMIISAQPGAALVGDALHDSLSLADSTIAGREDLAVRLGSSVAVISPAAAATYFPPRDGQPRAMPTPPPSVAEAREVLREVRYAVNQFRDERVEGIVGARNHIVWVVLAVAAAVHLALGLALVMGVSREAVVACSAFYLVGALTGLINRLRIESARQSAGEDYGLFLARLAAVPVLSGLSGIGGVFLVAVTPEFLAAFGAGTTDAMSLGTIFSLETNELGILVAAVFGLVPAQLFAGLQRQADRFQMELEKSEPSGGSSLPGAGG